jgi:multiple sugar transport system substrate-binding protein
VRLLPLLSLTLSAALVFSACTTATVVPGSTQDLPATTHTSSPPTDTPFPAIGLDPASLQGVRIQVWHAFSGASQQAFNSRLERFILVNDWGIVVEQTWQGDYPSLFAAVNSGLADGSTPDLVVTLPEQALAWDAQDAVVDLAPYVADPDWGMPAGDIQDIPSSIWEQDNVNGRRLGVPAERSARFLFYNQTWARELGFNSPPASADEFEQQACAANTTFRLDDNEQNDGYGGWIVDASWNTIYPWLLAFGGGVTDGNDYLFNNNANLEALGFLKTLKDDGCAWMTNDPDIPYALDPGPHYEQFSRRSALFITGDLVEAVDLSAELVRQGVTDEWSMIPFPGSQTQAITTYGPSYTVLTSTPEKQLAAWLFARWMLSPENQEEWVKAAGTLPLRTSSLSLLTDYASAHPQWQAAVDAMPFSWALPQRADWRTIRYVLADGALSIFRMDIPTAQIADVLNEMDASVEELSK